MGNSGVRISLCLQFIFNKINLMNTNTEQFSLTMLSGPPEPHCVWGGEGAGQNRKEHQQADSKEPEFRVQVLNWSSWVPSSGLPEEG